MKVISHKTTIIAFVYIKKGNISINSFPDTILYKELIYFMEIKYYKKIYNPIGLKGI